MQPRLGRSINVPDPLDNRELRLAVTMNGGVSLAVYMGAADDEILLGDAP
jgi:hypothetical protein